MPKVDQKIVQMMFDNKQFEQGVSQSTKSLENLKKSLDLDKSVKSLQNIERAANGFDLSGISNGIEAISEKFSALGILGITIMQRISNAAVDAGIRFAKSISVEQVSKGLGKYETQTKAVQTITNATGKSIEQVEEVLEELMHYTDETSYDFATMVSTIGKFTSVGVDLKVAEKAMEGIANEAAKSGAGVEEANRAMYNFAQALSAGYVKLQDWKSIENANMATKEFKEELIKTAIEMGKLGKTSDKVGYTQKQVKKATKKTAAEFKKTTVNYKSFNETLSSGWLTSDVLIKTLEKYSDLSTDFGKTAYYAAQKALTWTDAVNAVKDAVSSGWMQSFKYLFGNLQEAQDLWTNVANSMYDFVAIFMDARNELLKGWHEMGGYNAAVEAASNIWHIFMNVVRGVKDALEKVFPPLTAKRLVELTENVRDASEKLKNLLTFKEVEEVPLKEAVDYSKKLTDTLKKGTKGKQVKLLQERLLKAGYKLDKYGADGVYGPETEAAIRQLQKDLKVKVTGSWDEATRTAVSMAGIFTEIKDTGKTTTKVVSRTTQTMQRLHDILSGIFSAFKIGKSFIQTGFEIIKHFLSLFKPLAKPIINLGSIFGKFIDNYRKYLDKTNAFGKILEGAKKRLQPFGDAIAKVAKHFDHFLNYFRAWARNRNKFNFAGFLEYTELKLKKTKIGKALFDTLDKIKPIIDKIKEFFSTLKEAISGFFSADVSNVETFSDSLKKRLEPFTKVWEWIKTNIGNLFLPKDGESAEESIDIFATLAQKVKDLVAFIKSINVSQIALFAIAIIGAIKLYKKIKAPMDIVENIAKIPKELGKALSGRNKQKWLDSIGEFAKNLGIGVALLAVSVFGLAQLDLDKAIPAVIMVGALMAAIVGVAFAMKKLKLDSVNFKGIIKFAVAMLIITNSVVKLGKMPVESMVQGILGLGAVIAEMILFSKLMKKEKFQVGGLTDLGAGLSMIAGVIKTLGELNTKKLAKGVLGLGAILLELGVFMRLVSGKQFKQGPVAMIGLGLAVLMMAEALKGLSKLSWKEMLKGVTGLGAVLLELGLFMRLTSGFGSQQRFLGLVGIGVSVWLLAKSLIGLAKLDTKSMLRGVIGLGLVMTELAIFMVAIGGRNTKKQIGLAFAMVGIGIAVTLLASSLKSLAKIKTKAMIRGVVGLGAVMLELAAFMKLIGGRNALTMMGNSLALVGIGAAVNLFVLALAGLSMLKTEGIVKGLAALGVLFVELAVFMKLATGTSVSLKAMPVLIAMAGSILIFSLALSALGDVSWGKILSFSVGFKLVLDSISGAMKTLSKIPISGGLAALANLDLFIANFVLVLAAIGGLQELTNGGLGDWLEQGAQALGQAIGGFIHGIVSPFLDKKSGAGRQKETKSLTDYLNEFISDMSGVMDTMQPFLEKVKMIDSESVTGMTNLAAVLLAMTGTELVDTMANWIVGDETGSAFIAFAKDLVALMPYVKQFIDGSEGISLEGMKGVTEVLGYFTDIAKATIAMTAADIVDSIAQFIKSFGSGGTESSFVSFAKNLVELIPPINEFASKATSIDEASITKAGAGLKAFGEVCNAAKDIGWAAIVTGIADFITGGDSLGNFANRMIAMAPKLVAFSKAMETNSINETSITSASGAVKAFGDVCDAAKDIGWAAIVTGITDFITGKDSILSFADKMVELAPKLASFGTTASRINNDAISGAAGSLKALSEVANEIPAAGGLIQAIFGEHDIGGFGTKLSTLGSGIYKFYTETKDIPKDYSADGFASSLGALAQVAKDLPGAGGFINAIVGEQDLEDFGNKLAPLGAGLAAFATATKDIPSEYSSSGPISALQAMADLEAGLEAHGGFAQWFSGEKDIGAFGEKLAGLGTNLKTFSDSTVEVDPGQMRKIGIGLQELVKAVLETPEASVLQQNFGGLQWLVDSLANDYDYTGIQTIGEKVDENFKIGINQNGSQVTSEMATLLTKVSDVVKDFKTSFESKGKYIDIYLATGMYQAINHPVDMADRVMSKVCNLIKDYRESFESLGKYLDIGLAIGIYRKESEVTGMARRVARAAYDAACRELGIQSPSKKGAWIGEMFDNGFANGLLNYQKLVSDNAKNVGENAIESAKLGIQGLTDAIAADADNSPTIRPVLDLSQVRSGYDEMGSMFNSSPVQRMNLSASVSNSQAQRVSANGFQNEYSLMKESMNKSDSNMERMFSDFSEKFDRLENDMKNLKVYLDGRVLVGEISSSVSRDIGRQMKQDLRSR